MEERGKAMLLKQAWRADTWWTSSHMTGRPKISEKLIVLRKAYLEKRKKGRQP